MKTGEKKLKLPVGKILFLESDKIYSIECGRGILRERLGNGKCISHEHPIVAGEIIGGPALFLKEAVGDEILLQNLELELEILEEADISIISAEKISPGHLPVEERAQLLHGMVSLLQKRRISHSAYHAADKQAHILSILRRFADKRGCVPRSVIRPELFNVSKSQFYLLFRELMRKGYLKKLDGFYKINHKKAMEYQLEVIESIYQR